SHLLQRRVTHAPDELTRGCNVDEAPRTVFFVHGILVRLAQKTNAILLFHQIVNIRREASEFAIVKSDGARILLAPPDRLRFLLPLALSQTIHKHHRASDNQKRDKEQHKNEGEALLRTPDIDCRGWTRRHGCPCCGGWGGWSVGCASMRVVWRPEASSSTSTELLPIVTMRN